MKKIIILDQLDVCKDNIWIILDYKFCFFLALMQRALRILKDDKEIWIEYVRLELLYRKKLSDRLRLMGVNADELVRFFFKKLKYNEIMG